MLERLSPGRLPNPQRGAQFPAIKILCGSGRCTEGAWAMEPDPKTAARIAALQKEMDAIYHAIRTKASGADYAEFGITGTRFDRGPASTPTTPPPLHCSTWRDTITLIRRPCAACTHADAVEKLFVRLGNLPRPEARVECRRS